MTQFTPPVRYDRRILRRFLAFSLPLLMLAMAVHRFVLDALRMAPDPAILSRAAVTKLPGHVLIATWVLEAVALSALYLLIQGRGGSRWLNGLLTGWIAWVFRGPLLVVTVVGLAGLPQGPWWAMSFSWLLLYSVCGLLLGGAAAAAGLQP
jgi:hypothetical protein